MARAAQRGSGCNLAMNIGFVACDPSKMDYYFPTRAEPLLVCTELPFTPDDQFAVNTLRARGHDVLPVQWGAPVASLGDVDLIVVRSPWDYMDTPENTARFFAWIESLEQAGVTVANPSCFMRWLLDKHYLADLAKQGVSVIPTRYLDLNASLALASVFDAMGAFILKPCVSAAGVGLYFIDSRQTAQRYQHDVTQSLATRTYMLQAFVPEIVTRGEWSLIFISGKYSHAVHKLPAPNEVMVHAERGGSLNLNVMPPASVIDFATAAYEKMLAVFHVYSGLSYDKQEILYLRMDVIESASGPVLLECEGVEPELFFRALPASTGQFAAGIESLCQDVLYGLGVEPAPFGDS